MYSEQLEQLIKSVIADGAITKKERSVLHKKAAAEGIDKDEIDVYIDGLVANRAQIATVSVQPLTNPQKQSSVTKCPNCGETIPALSGICPSCGYELNIRDKNNSELSEIIESLEKALIELKVTTDYKRSKATIEHLSRKANLYYGKNEKVRFLIEEIENESRFAEKRAKSAARKQQIKKVLANKWTWCIIEIIIVVIAVIALAARQEYWEIAYEEARGTNRIFQTSENRDEIQIIKWLVILSGIVIVGFTGYLAAGGKLNSDDERRR